jgi:uncharacterized glyoxalase superfamily protein PhnB
MNEEKHAMKSLFPDICCDDVKAARDFYVALFGFEPVFEIAWYAQLRSPADPNLQIAFVQRDHDSVPAGHRLRAQGVLVTIEVEDAAAYFRRARELGAPIELPLCDEVWGQRHFMARDPAGLLVDVVELIPMAPEFAREHGLPSEGE